MVTAPGTIPETRPLVLLTEAVPEALLVQVPPDGVEFRVVVSPTHTLVIPVNAVGFGLTVNDLLKGCHIK